MKKLLTLLAGSTLAFYMQGCSDNATSADDDTPLSKGSVYVYTSEWTAKSGELRWIDEDGKLSKKSVEFYQDSKIVGVDGNLFVLEGSGTDNLILVDPSTNEKKWEKSLEDLANPKDVVKANKDEVWVALEGVSNFIKVAVKDGKIVKTVKTDGFEIKKGQSPHLVDFETRNDTLFGLFQRYTSTPSDDGYPKMDYSTPGLLAMYKLEDGSLLDTVQLVKNNPQVMGFAKGKLYVGSVGDYATADMYGIEVVDLAKKKSSAVVDGKSLGGGVYAMAFDSKDGLAYVAVYEGWGKITLAEVDLNEKKVKAIKGVSNITGSLAYDEADGVLYIGNDDAVYTYEDDKLNKVESAVKDVLPPYNITIVR